MSNPSHPWSDLAEEENTAVVTAATPPTSRLGPEQAHARPRRPCLLLFFLQAHARPRRPCLLLFSFRHTPGREGRVCCCFPSGTRQAAKAVSFVAFLQAHARPRRPCLLLFCFRHTPGREGRVC